MTECLFWMCIHTEGIHIQLYILYFITLFYYLVITTVTEQYLTFGAHGSPLGKDTLSDGG